MTITNIFFIVALIISIFFTICLVVLFICYALIYNRVNKNFKVVKHD